MLKVRAVTVASVSLLAILASQSMAQAAESRRHGFWFSGGLGYGSARVTCSECRGNEREDGLSGFLAFGGTPSPHWLLGLESDAWVKNQDQATITLGTAVAAVRYYPSVTRGWFLKGGIGLAEWSASAGGSRVSHDGFGVLAGLGVDLPVGRKVSLTPTVSYAGGWLGTVEGIDGVQQNVLQVSLGITAH